MTAIGKTRGEDEPSHSRGLAAGGVVITWLRRRSATDFFLFSLSYHSCSFILNPRTFPVAIAQQYICILKAVKRLDGSPRVSATWKDEACQFATELKYSLHMISTFLHRRYYLKSKITEQITLPHRTSPGAERGVDGARRMGQEACSMVLTYQGRRTREEEHQRTTVLSPERRRLDGMPPYPHRCLHLSSNPRTQANDAVRLRHSAVVHASILLRSKESSSRAAPCQSRTRIVNDKLGSLIALRRCARHIRAYPVSLSSPRRRCLMSARSQFNGKSIR